MVWRICTDNLHYEKFADGTVKCIEDEIPFEVPKGWEWCRLSNIVQFINGDRGKNYPSKSDYLPNGIPWINTGHILDEGILTEKEMLFISQEKYDSLHSGKIAENDLVLCLRGATFGKVARVKPYKIGAIASSLVIIRCYEYSLAEYLYYYLRSDLAIQQLHLYDNGSAQPNLAAGDVQKYLFPLPPIKEALMISERISILLALVSKISQEKRNLNAIIANIKTKILDLAIRGQLVPQNPDDEPASVLLERIRIEKEELIKQGKIKRDKKESIIFKGEDNSYYEKIDGEVRCIDEEIPFEIPDTWEWIRLEDLCQKEIRRGKSPKYAQYSQTLVFAQKCNTKYNGIDIGLAQFLDENTLSKYPVDEFMKDGDIVINSTGTGTLGRVGFYQTSDNIKNIDIVPDSHVTVVRAYKNINSFYLYAFMKFNQSELEKKGEGSTNQKELKPATLKEMFVPIPSITEQERISAAILKVFSIITAIERSLS